MISNDQIPKLYTKLLSWLCKEELCDELLGDLEEVFYENVKSNSIAYARSQYKLEIIKLIRPSVVKKLKLLHMNSSSGLFSNYAKIAFRNLLKDKSYSLISILGLALGIITSVLLIQFNQFEESYDSFHAKLDRIYRLRNNVKSQTTGEITTQRAATFLAVQPTVMQEVPDIINATHLYEGQGVLGYEKNSFTEERIIFSTASFFELFSFEVIKGNYQDLDKPRIIFLSQSMAKKLFGERDPIDKKIEYDGMTIGGHMDLVVKGIFQDFPINSHIKAEAIIPMAEFRRFTIDNPPFGPDSHVDDDNVKWRWTGFHTYVETHPNADMELLSEKLNAYFRKYRAQFDDRLGRVQEAVLQPLHTIHLQTGFLAELEPPGNKDLILFFYLVVALILTIAWINYINMATARAMNRGREVGIRKVLGAVRKQLIFQFLFESILTNIIAIIVSIGVLFLIIPYFELFIEKNVFDLFFEFKSTWMLFGIALLTGALISGLYPAFVLSSFKPAKVLKVSFKYNGHGIWLRKGLVVLQFMITILLLSGATTIQSQLSYMMNNDPGFSIDQSLVIRTPIFATRDSTYQIKINSLSASIDQLHGVDGNTLSSLVPGTPNRWRSSCGLQNDPDQESVFFSRMSVSPGYFDLYELPIIAGRQYSDDMKGDRAVTIMNKRGAQMLGFSNPADILDKYVTFPGNQVLKVIGVVDDFYQNGMLTDFEPMSIQLDTMDAGGLLTVKIEGNNIENTLSLLEQNFKNTFPNSPFDYFFLDQKFNDQYRADQKFQQIFNYFTAVAIFIACLGLIGLSSFFARQKTKEVTVRKVLGASISEILQLLVKEYIWLILFAGIISIPLSYFLIDYWLDNYVFHIDISVFMFAIPMIILSFIVFITVGKQTWETAITNPVDNLKNE